MTIQMMQVGVCFCENLERAGVLQLDLRPIQRSKQKRSFQGGGKGEEERSALFCGLVDFWMESRSCCFCAAPGLCLFMLQQ